MPIFRLTRALSPAEDITLSKVVWPSSVAVGIMAVLSIAACGGSHTSFAPNSKLGVKVRALNPPPQLPGSNPGLHPFQVFDGGISSPNPIASKYGAVWGSNAIPKPSEWAAGHPNMLVGYYLPMGLEANPGSFGNLGHNLAWWQTSSGHPDWIMWQCDGNTLARRQGLQNVPLHMSAAMFDFLWNDQTGTAARTGIHTYMKTNGYNSLDLDIVSFNNDGLACGTWADGIGHNLSTYHGSDVWTTVYDPSHFQKNDVPYVADTKAYITEAQVQAHSVFSPVMDTVANIPVEDKSPPPDLNADKDITYLVDHIDVLNLEQGFTQMGKAGSGSWPSETQFANTAGWSQYIQNHDGGAVLLLNSFDETSGGLTAPQIEWSLATYELINEGEADIWTAVTGGYGSESYLPEYSATFGDPCWDYKPSPSSSHVHYRVFKKGVAIVNNGAMVNVKFAADFGLTVANYTDIEGQPLTDQFLMPAHTAILAYSGTAITCP